MKEEKADRRRIHPGIAALILIVGLLTSFACKSNDLTEGLTASFSANKAEYGQGEAIQLQLLLRNDNEGPMTLTFASSQVYDFWVQDPAGNEVWRWSASKVFAAVITHVDILPGATIEYMVTWEQLSDEGIAVPPGTYTIYAGIVIASAPRIDPITIGIR